MVVNPGAGLIFDLISNSGFNYDLSGNPTGGTVNAIAIYDTSYNILANSNGWGFNLATFQGYVTTHNFTGLDTIFGTVNYNAVGNFEANNNFNNHAVNFGGDTFLSGIGNDIFNGLTNANGDYNERRHGGLFPCAGRSDSESFVAGSPAAHRWGRYRYTDQH